MFLAELRRKVPVNDDDLIPANLPRQALRNEFFALLAVGRLLGTYRWTTALYAIIEIAAGDRAWLQPLPFHNLAGGAADYRQVPGRSAHECASRRSSRFAGRAATREEAVGPDQKPEGTGSLIGPLQLHHIGWA